MADLVDEEKRGTAYGFYNLFYGITVFPASLLFGLLWNQFGAPAAFVTSAIISVVAAVMMISVRPSSSNEKRDGVIPVP